MSKDKPVIEVNGISKRYNISHKIQKNAHPTIKDEIVRLSRKPLEILGSAGSVDKESFWALKDLSFKVNKGEVVGVMGRNGSGKSTLFKILSRITQPTEGEAVLRGKTASLLEVGTGFNPELTGRENVYLNGSILGMKKSEIDERFDDIIKFSEVGKFIDTPVKFYSSGMKVRLAFAVAINVNADILIIDEVLAVGDLRFKQKSIAKMNEIAASGKTILFVSHIVRHIQRICTRGIVLDGGKLVLDTDVEPAVNHYLDLLNLDESQRKDASEEDDTDPENNNTSEAEVNLFKSDVTIKSNKPTVRMQLEVKNNTEETLKDLRLIVRVTSQLGQKVATLTNDIIGKEIEIGPNQKKEVAINIDEFSLVPDKYDVRFVLREVSQKGRKFCVNDVRAAIDIPEYDTGNYQNELAIDLGNRQVIKYDIEVK